MKNIKTAKKSMFITTLLIVVLLIAAVATATFAWFTQQDTVTAGGTTTTAANAVGASVGIGWDATTATNATSFSIDFGSMEDAVGAVGGLRPMAPAALPALGDATTFIGGFTGAHIDGEGEFIGDGVSLDPFVLHRAGYATTTLFHVGNISAAGGDDVASLVLTTGAWTGSLAGLLRIAVFVDGGYIGTLSQAGGATVTVYGEINGGDSHLDMDTYTSSETSLQLLPGDSTVIAPQDTITVVMIAWFDGRALTNPLAGGDANVAGFTFTAAVTYTP